MARDGRTWLFWMFCVILFLDFVYCVETKKEYAENGKSFTFKPNVKAEITMIAWKFTQKSGDVIKLVDWDPRTGIYWYSGQNRADLTAGNGELTINKVTKDDSGLYEVELEVNRVLTNILYEFTVMDGVSEPQVICEFKDNTIELVGSVNPPVKAEFTWTGPDEKVMKGERISVPKGQSKESIYFCTAKNEVSTKATEWKLAKCYEVLKPDPLSGGVIFAIVLAVLAVLGGSITGALWKLKPDLFCRSNAEGTQPECTGMLQASETNPPEKTPNSNGGNETANQDKDYVNVDNEVVSAQANEVQEK